MLEFKIDDRKVFRSMPFWGVYRKLAKTLAVRIEGPFRVQTAEGWLECQDGYLALDSRGYPYPICKDEFESIYVCEANLAGKTLFNDGTMKNE